MAVDCSGLNAIVFLNKFDFWQRRYHRGRTVYTGVFALVRLYAAAAAICLERAQINAHVYKRPYKAMVFARIFRHVDLWRGGLYGPSTHDCH